MLVVFGGLPGTGKTTLSQRVAAERHAVYLRIDAIEHALASALPEIGPAGYAVAAAVAEANLRLGLSVVIDAVNPVLAARNGWRRIAEAAAAALVELEVVCSDAAEHRRRVEARVADIPGFRLPTWDDVVGRGYEPWDRPRVVVDTAGYTITVSHERVRHALATVDFGAAAPSS